MPTAITATVLGPVHVILHVRREHEYKQKMPHVQHLREVGIHRHIRYLMVLCQRLIIVWKTGHRPAHRHLDMMPRQIVHVQSVAVSMCPRQQSMHVMFVLLVIQPILSMRMDHILLKFRRLHLRMVREQIYCREFPVIPVLLLPLMVRGILVHMTQVQMLSGIWVRQNLWDQLSLLLMLVMGEHIIILLLLYQQINQHGQMLWGPLIL